MFARQCHALVVGSLLAVPSAGFCDTDLVSKKSGDKAPAQTPQAKLTAPIKNPETRTDAPNKKTIDKSPVKEPGATDRLTPTNGRSSPIIIEPININPIIIEPINDKACLTELIC